MRSLLIALLIASTITSASQTRADSLRLVMETLKYFDLQFNESEVDSMLSGLVENKELYSSMHKTYPPNDLVYPFAFNPAPGLKVSNKKEKISWE